MDKRRKTQTKATRQATPKAERMWAITGVFGLYCDTAFTRTDMISKHCAALGRTWQYCRNKGDRAIKVLVSPI